MNYQLIEIHESYEGQVSEIILKPAPANVLSRKMISEILSALEEQKKIRHKKLILFSGEGKHFSFGASVPEHLPGTVETMLPEFHRFIGEVLACEIPTLAMVRGCCLGGGFELALACSFIFAGADAKFAVPESTLGVFPPPACILLPGRSGDAFAMEMILGGRMFSGEQLHKRNVINAVSPIKQLESTVAQFIRESILPKSAATLKIAHRAARQVTLERYRQHIDKLERLYLQDLMSTGDAREGLNAFLEKRDAKWENA